MELPDIQDAETILKANDVKIEPVQCPEWGCTVYVRTFDGDARDQYDAGNVTFTDDGATFNMERMRARLCALTMCKKDGTLLFSQDQVEALGKKSGVALDRVFAASQKLNGLRKEDVDFFRVSLKPVPNS